MAESKIEPAAAEVAEPFFEFCRRPGLLMTHFCAELARNLLEPFPGDLVPAAVVHRAGREQADTHGVA